MLQKLIKNKLLKAVEKGMSKIEFWIDTENKTIKKMVTFQTGELSSAVEEFDPSFFSSYIKKDKEIKDLKIIYLIVEKNEKIESVKGYYFFINKNGEKNKKAFEL